MNKGALDADGAGFIGSKVCEALIKQGKKVSCLDNFATGKKENF